MAGRYKDTRIQGYKLRGCQHYQIGLCPGICAGKINQADYRKIVKQLITVLSGGKKRVIGSLRSEMKKYAKKRQFEKAAELRDKIRGLEHIGAVSLISKKNQSKMTELEERIEGYDVANISGKLAVGVMVVYEEYKDTCQGRAGKIQSIKHGGFNKDEYRMFKIRMVQGANDVAMMGELLARRSKHKEWPKPSLIIIDGGAGQVNVANLQANSYKLQAPIVGIAKGPDRKGERLFFGESQFEFRFLPEWARKNLRLIKKVRDEAHRFSQRYFHLLQKREQKSSELKMIKGIGDKAFKKLILNFGTLEKINAADFAELSKLVGKSKAEKIKRS